MARLRNVSLGDSGTPAGAVIPYAGTTAPSGWLLCDGAAISRTTYSSLYTSIGTNHGAGDGVATFNIPDLRQRFILGKSISGIGAILGTIGGTIDHSHTLPAHYHAMGTGADLNIASGGAHWTDIGHSHSAGTTGAGTAHTHANTLATDTGTAHTHAHTLGTDTVAAHVHDIAHGHTASSSATSHSHAHTLGTDTVAAHVHDIAHGHTASSSATSHTHAHTLGTDAVAAHVHDIAHGHTASASTTSVGLGSHSHTFSGTSSDSNVTVYAKSGENINGAVSNSTRFGEANILSSNGTGLSSWVKDSSTEAHSHTYSGTTNDPDLGHSHTISVTVNNLPSTNSVSGGSHSHTVNTGSITPEASHTHAITVASLTATNSASGGSHSHAVNTGSITAEASHTHAITVASLTATNSASGGSHSHEVNTGSISNESLHTHPITGSISNESLHTHSFTTPAFVGDSSSQGQHTHTSGSIGGRIGLITGGVDGNSGMTSSTSNPPFYVLNHIIKF